MLPASLPSLLPPTLLPKRFSVSLQSGTSVSRYETTFAINGAYMSLENREEEEKKEKKTNKMKTNNRHTLTVAKLR